MVAAAHESPADDRARRPTLKSVAAAAGVSLSTASLVFSGKGPVAPATSDRVRAAAAALGYEGPDPLASSLRTGRAGIVAVILEGRLLYAFRDPYEVSVLDGLATILDEIPVGMLLVSQDAEEPERVRARLAGTALDAAVFVGCGAAENLLVEHLASRQIPIVALGAPRGEGLVDIDVDDVTGMRAAARHLHDLGHRDVATVALYSGRPASDGILPLRDLAAAVVGLPVTSRRLQGVAEVFGDDVPCTWAPTSDIDSGAYAAGLLLDGPRQKDLGDGGPDASIESPRRPTAILAQSDMLAMGVVRAAAKRGLRVPEDLSVTGFDGVALPWYAGTLTTVVQPGADKGRAAGEAVRLLLDGGSPASAVLPTNLRVGTSTAPPHAD